MCRRDAVNSFDAMLQEGIDWFSNCQGELTASASWREVTFWLVNRRACVCVLSTAHVV